MMLILNMVMAKVGNINRKRRPKYAIVLEYIGSFLVSVLTTLHSSSHLYSNIREILERSAARTVKARTFLILVESFDFAPALTKT
jgi:hypothetical protein